jgi:DNA-binding MarR family transcriptional regulator
MQGIIMNKNSAIYLLHKLVIKADKRANRLLLEKLGISYKRFHFLLTLQDQAVLTQHEIAVALGQSDPAVSTMVQSLTKAGYITNRVSTSHARKHLVQLTPAGVYLVKKSSTLLHKAFDEIVVNAGIDAKQFTDSTFQLLSAFDQKK